MQMADERKIFLGSDFLFGKCFLCVAGYSGRFSG